ncbi:MAG: hypothetical protein JKX70_02405 [Phycisphaerales bacterium]|nr:hypothetical protein [Phycisphaerales bacterium]
MRNMKNSSVCALALIASVGMVAQGETFVVELDGSSFVFDGMLDMDIDLNITVGDTVRWEWVSGLHNVVSGLPGSDGAGDLFFSGAPTDDDTTFFEFTFEEVGVYEYHCHVHGGIGMVSFVTVAVPSPGTMFAIAPMGLVLMRRRR